MGGRGPAGRPWPTVPCAYAWRVGRGEVGLEDGFATSRGMAISYCREYLLFSKGVGWERDAEFGGRGEPEDDGVYCCRSRPPKES